MPWFTLVCIISGFVVGWVLKTPVAVALTSFQIVLFVVSLFFATEMDGGHLFLWCLTGLFGHQGAYLAGVIVRSFSEERHRASTPTVSAKIENKLTLIESLAARIAAMAPAPASEDALCVSRLVSEVRVTLGDQDKLEALLIEKRRSM